MSDDFDGGVEAPEPADQAPEGSGVPEGVSPDVPESSPWESFRSLPQFEGKQDREIAAGLYQAMQREEAASRALRQYQQVMPIAQEYLTNRSEYEQWKQAQRQQQAQQPAQQVAQQAAEGWWNPPKVSDSFRRYLTKDEAGRDVIHPDAPLEARAALTEWMNYRADFAQKFLNSPEEALGPMVQELAQQQAQELIEKTLERRDNEAFVAEIEEANKDWLTDPETGNVSPAGLLVNKYIEQAKSLGINGPRPRWDYAVAMTERDMMIQHGQQEPQQAPPVQQPVQEAPPPQDMAQKNMEYLKREASRNPSRSSGAANSGDARQPRPRRTFEQMLLDEAGNRDLL